MIDWLLSRPTVISLAIIGGLLSLAVSWARSRGVISEQKIVWLNKASYVFMGLSMVLFIAAGFFGKGS